MFSEWLMTAAEILTLFAIAAFFFLVVVPAALWCYDRVGKARRKYRMAEPMDCAHIESASDAEHFRKIEEIFDGLR